MKLLTLMILVVTLMFGAVDINTATKKELSSLYNIGPKKSDLIIAYRDVNCFNSIEELEKVKGIGKKTVDKNRDNLIAGDCKVK